MRRRQREGVRTQKRKGAIGCSLLITHLKRNVITVLIQFPRHAICYTAGYIALQLQPTPPPQPPTLNWQLRPLSSSNFWIISHLAHLYASMNNPETQPALMFSSLVILLLCGVKLVAMLQTQKQQTPPHFPEQRDDRSAATPLQLRRVKLWSWVCIHTACVACVATRYALPCGKRRITADVLATQGCWVVRLAVHTGLCLKVGDQDRTQVSVSGLCRALVYLNKTPTPESGK